MFLFNILGQRVDLCVFSFPLGFAARMSVCGD